MHDLYVFIIIITNIVELRFSTQNIQVNRTLSLRLNNKNQTLIAFLLFSLFFSLYTSFYYGKKWLQIFMMMLRWKALRKKM